MYSVHVSPMPLKTTQLPAASKTLLPRFSKGPAPGAGAAAEEEEEEACGGATAAEAPSAAASANRSARREDDDEPSGAIVSVDSSGPIPPHTALELSLSNRRRGFETTGTS